VIWHRREDERGRKAEGESREALRPECPSGGPEDGSSAESGQGKEEGGQEEGSPQEEGRQESCGQAPSEGANPEAGREEGRSG